MTLRRKMLIVAGVSIGVLAATAWLSYPRQSKQTLDPFSAPYLYCSKCDREWPQVKDRPSIRCPRCEQDMIGLAESIRKTGRPPNRLAGFWMVLYAEFVVAMAAVLFVFKRHVTADETVYLFMRCPKCEQKLRFAERQIGNVGKCPRCKRPFIFPADSLPEEEGAEVL